MSASQGRLTRRSAVLAAAVALLSPTAASQSLAQSDPRIRTVFYEADQVVSLRGFLGYQLLIEFDPSEAIENVAIGDSVSWQVTPNRAATRLFIKPLTDGVATNLTVVTTMRRYSFTLIAGTASGPNDPRMAYVVRFAFPQPSHDAAPVAPEPARRLNFSYEVSGARRLVPTQIFDDGHSTFFVFSEARETPAIFSRGADGREELVNTRMEGDVAVADQIADEFVLRWGRHRALVRRTGDGAVNVGSEAR